MKKITILTLASLIGLVGCSDSQNRNPKKNSNQKSEIPFGPKPFHMPLIMGGPYEGMGYRIIDKELARKENMNPLIEIRDIRSGKSLTVIYNEEGSVKEFSGSLNYIPEEVEKIRLTDKAFKGSTTYRY